jgi:hypothetical protein
MKALEGLNWIQMNNAQMGCIKGALEFLKKEMSTAWLFGGSGYAFVINISKAADESCPTAWNNQMIYDLAPNLGIKISGFSISKQAAGENFPAKQREAGELIRAGIDHGLPCYGWEVQPWMPEFGLITGYDEVGYYYASYAAGGPVKWEEYGDHDVKVIQVYSVEPCQPAPDRKVLKDVLEAVLQHAATPQGWADGVMYTTGPTAFDVWASSLESGEAKRDGTSYNALVWHECRAQAVDFLQEARRRLSGQISPACDRALEEAASAYAQARDALKELTVLVPMNMEIWDGSTPLQSGPAAVLVRTAGAAESRALNCLKEAASAL